MANSHPALPILSRRRFLISTATGIFSALVHGAVEPPHDSTGNSSAGLSLTADPQSGTFSISLDGVPVIRRAHFEIHTEDEVITPARGRFSVVHEGSRLLFSDTQRVCDLYIDWRLIEKGSLLAFDVGITNRTRSSLRVTDIVPIRALASDGGGFAGWRDPSSVRVLTDEWERCYGAAGVVPLLSAQKIRSAWNLHAIDMETSRTITISTFAVPRTKCSVELRAERGRRAADLIVRCDTRGGRRGVLLSAGGSFQTGEIMVRAVRGSIFEALESYAVLLAHRNNVPPPSLHPIGWVDWYFAKGATTEQDVLDNLDFIARELKDYGLEYIQIDSGWQLGVETTSPPHNVIAGGPWIPNSKFPRGMKWYADRIRERGFRPGIWVRPFHMIDGAAERVQHPDWFNDRGQMDFSHPGVRSFVRELFRILTDEWGYEYIKYDFPSFDLFGEWGPRLFDDHAARQELSNPELTNIQAYRESIVEIASTVRGKAHLLACNSVMPPTIGAAEVFRIGDDVGDWGRTFRYGVKSVSARYYTNGTFWANDPDCLLVREPFTIEEARSWASLIALSGGVVFISEHLVRLPAERLEIVRKVLPSYRNDGRGFRYGRPIDLLENNPPRLWHLPVRRPFGYWDVVGVFNWSEEPESVTLDFARVGFPRDTRVCVFDFWEERYLGERKENVSFELPAHGCKVLSLHRPQDIPHLISTGRHVTQGGVELGGIAWVDSERVLRGVARVVGGNPYKLFIRVPSHFHLQQVSGAVLERREGALAVLTVASEVTEDVAWSVEFERS